MTSLEIINLDVLNKKRERQRFIDLPWQLYAKDKTWVPPMRMSVEDVLQKGHPYYETSEAIFFMAKKDGKDVARLAAFYNRPHNDFHQESTVFFGFYESINDQEIAQALFSAVEKWAIKREATQLRGPFNPSTNYECGLLIEGFDDPPQVMMTYQHPYYLDHLSQLGFQKAKDLIAYDCRTDIDMPEVIKKIADRTEKKERVTYRTLNMKNWKHEIDCMLEIYNDAWEKNWGFVPMSEAEFRHTANDLKMVVDPELVLFVLVEGKEVGFIVCLPDLNQLFKKNPSGKLFPFGLYHLLTGKKKINRCRVITLGLKKDFRKRGLEALLYKKIQDHVLARGQYETVEMSWILEDNLEMNKPIIRMGGVPYKKYRILEKSL